MITSRCALIIGVILLASMNSVTLSAQQASGYFVVPSSALSEEQNSYLENKIKQSLASSGVGSVDGFYPMVTVGRYMEIEVKSYEGGMRNMYQVSGEVSVSVEFEGANAVLASTVVSVQGSGYSQEVARNTAIRSFKLSKEKVEELFRSAEKRAEPLLNSYAEKKVREVNGLLAKQECYQAADVISEIPSGTKQEPTVLKLTKQTADCVDKQNRAATKRQELESERSYKLDSLKLTSEERLESIRQSGFIKRTEINARSSARDRYYIMFR